MSTKMLLSTMPRCREPLNSSVRPACKPAVFAASFQPLGAADTGRVPRVFPVLKHVRAHAHYKNFAVFIFAGRHLSTKNAKFCTARKFPANGNIASAQAQSGSGSGDKMISPGEGGSRVTYEIL